MANVPVHDFVKLEEQKQNMPQYRWYVECSCGFQGRVGTEEAAKSQYDNHLKYHGKEPYFSKLVTEEKPETTKPLTPAGSDWKPVGAK